MASVSIAQAGGETIVTDLNGVADGLILGQQVRSMGSYELSLTGSLEAPLEIIGDAGTGTFTQTGGTNTTVIMTLGNTIDGDGAYLLTGGELFAEVETIGFAGPGQEWSNVGREVSGRHRQTSSTTSKASARRSPVRSMRRCLAILPVGVRGKSSM